MRSYSVDGPEAALVAIRACAHG